MGALFIKIYILKGNETLATKWWDFTLELFLYRYPNTTGTPARVPVAHSRYVAHSRFVAHGRYVAHSRYVALGLPCLVVLRLQAWPSISSPHSPPASQLWRCETWTDQMLGALKCIRLVSKDNHGCRTNDDVGRKGDYSWLKLWNTLQPVLKW